MTVATAKYLAGRRPVRRRDAYPFPVANATLWVLFRHGCVMRSLPAMQKDDLRMSPVRSYFLRVPSHSNSTASNRTASGGPTAVHQESHNRALMKTGLVGAAAVPKARSLSPVF